MQKKLWIVPTFVVCLSAMTLMADQPQSSTEKSSSGDKSSSDEKSKTDSGAYLGVLVDSVHPAFAANLRGLLSAEQGLTVEDVEDDSPAAKAGIRTHDILTRYDDQKLFSAEQLAKLVHSDKAGRTAKMEVLRSGELQKLDVKLGEGRSSARHSWMPFHDFSPFQQMHPGMMHPGMHHHFNRQQTGDSDWTDFDSLSLKRTGKDKFKAEVEYLDKDGKTKKHSFEGTRAEIRKSIEAEKDMKPEEKEQLLQSLNLSSSDGGFPMPHAWFRPGVWHNQPGHDIE